MEPAREIERIVPKGPFADCEHCPLMIAVPAGWFVMGSAATEPGHNDTEGPMQVTINYPFGVGRFEVTRDQFAAFIDDTRHVMVSGCLVGGKYTSSANWLHPGFEQAGNHPVVCVSWRDAKAYVEWLSRKTGRTYRLLSEAEWEYMARGGEASTYALGPVLLAAHANFNRARDGTIPIGFTSANAFGVHDVHGNAWEMVEDCWNSDLSFNSRNGRATTWRGDCSERAIRGGGWNSTGAAIPAGGAHRAQFDGRDQYGRVPRRAHLRLSRPRPLRRSRGSAGRSRDRPRRAARCPSRPW